VQRLPLATVRHTSHTNKSHRQTQDNPADYQINKEKEVLIVKINTESFA